MDLKYVTVERERFWGAAGEKYGFPVFFVVKSSWFAHIWRFGIFNNFEGKFWLYDVIYGSPAL